MRFLLLDRVLELGPGQTITGIKCWTLSEEYFFDHFPGRPVVPGVLLLESMAQLLGLLIKESHKKDHPDDQTIYPILSVVHRAKFRDVVLPGDRCVLKGALTTLDLSRAAGEVKVHVEDRFVAEATLSFVIISQASLPDNPYMLRHDEYHRILMQEHRPLPR